MIETTVILPTRGLIFAKVIKELETLRVNHPLKVVVSDDLKNPEGLNKMVKENIKKTSKYFLFIEEDTVPIRRLSTMGFELDQNPLYGAACINYPLINGQSSVVRVAKSNEIAYCGLGFTLVKKEIFTKLNYPWFRSDIAFRLNEKKWVKVDPNKQYGLYDIYFFTNMRDAGYQIIQIPGLCEHLKLRSLNNTPYNGQLHNIGLKSEKCEPSYINLDPKEYL